MEDNKQWVQTYFEIRVLRSPRADAELKINPHTAEERNRLRRSANPGRCAQRVGHRNGPCPMAGPVRSGEFAVYRSNGEKAFADRAIMAE